MSKRARHPPGFYELLLIDACDSGYKSKYRLLIKLTVLGAFEVERVVAKRIQGRETAYFVQWKHYSPEQNTWEPADHLPEELISAFENRSENLSSQKCYKHERLEALLFR